MRTSCVVAFVFIVNSSLLLAQEKSKTFTIGDGRLAFTAASNWTAKKPRFAGIVDAEYEVPTAKGDETPGRFTAGPLGGPPEDNVNRWIGQFVGPGGSAAKPQRDKSNVGGAEIEIVDLSGTYKDTPGGPVAGGKPILRENYRMLGAIIQTKDKGNYFLKLYGPKATIGENEKGFQETVKSLKVK